MQFHPLVVKLPKFRLEEHHTHTPPSTPLFSSPQALVPTDFHVVAGSAPPSESKHTGGMPPYSSRSTTMRLQPPGKMRQTLEEALVPTDFHVVAGPAPPSESKHTGGRPPYSSRSTTMRLQPPGKMRQTLEEGVKKHGKGVAPKGGIKQTQ